MEYKIIDFYEQTGQIKVKLSNNYEFSIIIPIENGSFIEGDVLDAFIKSSIPFWDMQRYDDLKKGINNSESIKKLVIKEPVTIKYSDSYEPTNFFSESWMAVVQIREKRNNLLLQTDWVALNDCPLDEQLKLAYLSYRQKLRDLPQQENFPEEVVWPELPSILDLED